MTSGYQQYDLMENPVVPYDPLATQQMLYDEKNSQQLIGTSYSQTLPLYPSVELSNFTNYTFSDPSFVSETRSCTGITPEFVPSNFTSFGITQLNGKYYSQFCQKQCFNGVKENCESCIAATEQMVSKKISQQNLQQTQEAVIPTMDTTSSAKKEETNIYEKISSPPTVQNMSLGKAKTQRKCHGINPKCGILMNDENIILSNGNQITKCVKNVAYSIHCEGRVPGRQISCHACTVLWRQTLRSRIDTKKKQQNSLEDKIAILKKENYNLKQKVYNLEKRKKKGVTSNQVLNVNQTTDSQNPLG